MDARFKCLLCGYTVAGDDVDRLQRMHMDIHAERERDAAWRHRLTADDLEFLKVQKIAFDGWINEDDGA